MHQTHQSQSQIFPVKFCPTNEMWADVLTKLSKGQKFRDMRAFLQNCPRDYNNDPELKLWMKP